MTKYQNPQEWLNQNYPNKNQVEEINLNRLEKEKVIILNFDQLGELTIDNYPNLKEIKGEYVSNLTKLTISNCPQLEKLGIKNFANNQQLVLNDVSNLRELNCSQNKLTSLDLSNCNNLQKIDCSDNQLTQIKFPKEKKIVWLDLSNNNFDQNLSFLRGLVNLEILWLGSNIIKGSLEPLKNMSRLKELNISNTDINSGLEYLPESLERFICSADERKDAKVKTIYYLFANKLVLVERDKDGYIKNFAQKLQDLKNRWKISTNQWMEIGLRLADYSFAEYLKIKDYPKRNLDLESLREEHENWLKEKSRWEELHFNEEEIEFWTKAGLKIDEFSFAEYLKFKGHSPSESSLNLIELKKEYQQELNEQKSLWERLQWKEMDDTILHQRWKDAYQKPNVKFNQEQLQDQIKSLEEEKQKLIKRNSFLEELTVENKGLIKEQKETIVSSYLISFTEEEKDSLEELIKVHKTYMEAKKHREETNKFYKQLFTLRQKLENKLGDKFIEAVEIILTNFEELYQREWDLQKQLEEKEINSNSKQLIEEKIRKSKQALIDFIEQEKQITENNYLLGKLGKVEELACLQSSEQTAQTQQATIPHGIPSSSNSNK